MWKLHRTTNRNFFSIYSKQGRKLPLDTPKRMIERREREGERERKVEGEI